MMAVLQVLRRYGTLVGFGLILLVFWVNLPDTFMTARNWLNISQQLSMLMVVAAGMTIVMVMGDFDLSVGSMASLAGIVAAILMAGGYPVWAAVGIALMAGLIGGGLNGVLVSLIGILPFVATLATLTIFSGVAFILSGGKTISGRAIPEGFGNFAREGIPLGEIGGVALSLPNLTIVAVLTVLLVWLLLEQTTVASVPDGDLGVPPLMAGILWVMCSLRFLALEVHRWWQDEVRGPAIDAPRWALPMAVVLLAFVMAGTIDLLSAIGVVAER